MAGGTKHQEALWSDTLCRNKTESSSAFSEAWSLGCAIDLKIREGTEAMVMHSHDFLASSHVSEHMDHIED